MGSHSLLQGIFLTQGSNPSLLRLLNWQAVSLPLLPPGRPPLDPVTFRFARNHHISSSVFVKTPPDRTVCVAVTVLYRPGCVPKGLKGCQFCFFLCHGDDDDDNILEAPWGLARPSGRSMWVSPRLEGGRKLQGGSVCRYILCSPSRAQKTKGICSLPLSPCFIHPLRVFHSDLGVQVSRTWQQG